LKSGVDIIHLSCHGIEKGGKTSLALEPSAFDSKNEIGTLYKVDEDRLKFCVRDGI
jgi:hypothetical protein